MFNQVGGQSVPLSTFGGLVLEAPAVSLSEGSSPLCWDVDFAIGDVHTRPGLQSQLSTGLARDFVWVQSFPLQNGQLYTLALDNQGSLWREDVTNDPGTLVNFNTVYFPPTSAGVFDTYADNTSAASGPTSLAIGPITAVGTQFAMLALLNGETFGGVVYPSGFTASSVTNVESVEAFGSVTGTQTLTTDFNNTADAVVGIVATWFAAGGATILQQQKTSTSSGGDSATLTPQFSSDCTTGSGIIVLVEDYNQGSAGVSVSVRDSGGNQYDEIAQVTTHTSLSSYSNLAMWYAPNTSATQVKVTVTLANASGLGNYLVKIFEIAGLGGFTTGATAFGTVAFQREYICFGYDDIPRQYDGDQIFDRISQEGPGGPVKVNVPSTANPNLANITSYAVASGTVTFQATNAFTTNEIVQISLSGTPFDGAVGIITAATSSSFAFATTVANTASTPATGTATPLPGYPISSITQPTAVNLNGKKIQWTSAPDANGTGTNLHIYYGSTQDANIAAAFAAGLPCYVYLSNMPGSIPDGTYLVTSIGKSIYGSNDYDYYFAVTMPSSNYYKTTGGASTTYQVTLATISLSTPMPGAVVGNQITIIDDTDVASWNGSWTIVQAPNSGVYQITETACDSSGNATYTYTVQSGNSPATGDLVTVTGCTNGQGANGYSIFNITNAVISGTGAGTFTVALASYPTGGVVGAAESGQAELTSNTFQIDPGQLFVGTSNTSSPIFGNSTTGLIAQTASNGALVVSPGTRQCVVMFLTQNGYLTRASAPVTFTAPSNTASINVQNIPIGPPNVIARWIAFTEAGANGVPGAYFYVIPLPVTTVLNGQTTTYQPTVINDNTTTSATFSFVDSVLLSSTEIDIQGANQFQLVELGNSIWNIFYAGRMFYGLEENKVPNFTNMTFQGGYYSANGPQPTGWTLDPTYGAGGYIGTGTVWGDAYFISNTSGSTQSYYGMITQGAYQDAYNVAILQPNTLYSVRVTAASASGGSGDLVVDLTTFNTANGTYGPVLGTYSIPLSTIQSRPQRFISTWVTTGVNPVPSTAVIRVYMTNMANNTQVEIDRIEVFPTNQPVNNTQLRVSYQNNAEAFDAVTGVLGVGYTNTQPCNGAFVMYDQLYILKSGSMFSTQDTPGSEPSGWQVSEVSNVVGTCGPNSYDVGEEWAITACRQGVYVFYGRQPIKISQEIYPLWEAINWDAAGTIWLRNDIVNRRITIGVPMTTPNAYLPNAPTNTNPTSPNVVLMCNYLGLGDVMSLGDGEQMHTTMFGTLMSVDMRRKWTIWQIASPYADFITRQDGFSKPLFICNGTETGKIYDLSDTQYSDDGTAINGLYTTWGWSDPKEQMQTLLGAHRKQWNYLQMTLAGSGTFKVTAYAGRLAAASAYTYNAPGFTLKAAPNDDYELPLNVTGNRMFLQFSTNAVGAYFNMQHVIAIGKVATLALRGSASQNG